MVSFAPADTIFVSHEKTAMSIEIEFRETSKREDASCRDKRPERRRETTSRRTAAAPPPRDPYVILGDFSDAISVMTIVVRSLEAQEIATVGDEAVALRCALKMLLGAYVEFDTFISQLPSECAASSCPTGR